MIDGLFYFLTDEYFQDFPDPYIMKNKEIITGHTHDRPCFYAFKDAVNPIYWMIPFSSKVDSKYVPYNKKLYQQSIY